MTNYLAMRGALSRLGWPGGIPSAIPTVQTIPSGMGYANVHDPNALVSQDKLTCTLPFGGTAVIEVIHPVSWNGRCTIFHAGHDEFVFTGSNPLLDANGEGMCRALTAAGDRIFACSMPFYGNNPPVYQVDGYSFSLNTLGDNHAQLADYERLTGASCLPVFYESAIQAINYAFATYGVKFVDMLGHSGGGQSTDFVPAVDTRVRRSYAFEGGLPFPLWPYAFKTLGEGDFESNQTCKEFPNASPPIGPSAWWPIMGGDWTNLATLGCIDPGRRRVQLLGDHDPVWPVYAMHDKVRAYEAQINARVPAGQHEVFIDTQCVQHAFTKAMISKVLADMGAP